MDEITDKRDMQKYRTVKIGNSWWMAENLNALSFANGDIIPEAKSFDDWQMAANKRLPAWCYYNFDQKNGEKFGKMYNWYAVIDQRGISPEGWHIPTNEDWENLEFFVGGPIIAGLNLMSKYFWNKQRGFNLYGFSALPSGTLDFDIKCFMHLGDIGYWWTKSQIKPSWSNDLQVIIRSIVNTYDNLQRSEILEDRFALSIRCIKGI